MRRTLARIVYSFLFLLISLVGVSAQSEKPFWNEIQKFKHKDSISMPPAHAILFVGSSSFRHWKNLKQSFPDYTVINRGFGGSSIPDVINYANEIIFPYNPKQIIFYCGENDLASDEAPSPQQVAQRFTEIFNLIRNKMKDVNFVFIAIKPSPSRIALLSKEAETNALIKAFLKSKANTTFVDVYTKMLDAKGSPRADLFGEDMLHMNAKGYQIWIDALNPYLMK